MEELSSAPQACGVLGVHIVCIWRQLIPHYVQK